MFVVGSSCSCSVTVRRGLSWCGLSLLNLSVSGSLGIWVVSSLGFMAIAGWVLNFPAFICAVLWVVLFILGCSLIVGSCCASVVFKSWVLIVPVMKKVFALALVLALLSLSLSLVSSLGSWKFSALVATTASLPYAFQSLLREVQTGCRDFVNCVLHVNSFIAS